MGFEPLQIVPAVLLSELITGFLAGFSHHSVGNVNLMPRTMKLGKIIEAIRRSGVRESFEKGVPPALKVTLLLAACSIVGTVISVILALSLPKYYLTLYIGVLVIVIGLTIILTMKKQFGFSWKRLFALGFIASFNKGISGGGYGPVVTGGQILAGVDGKNAIGITSLAEGLTCAVGVIVYLASGKTIDWTLAPYLITGAVVSVPLSAFTVKFMSTARMRGRIGFTTLILGIYTLTKLLK